MSRWKEALLAATLGLIAGLFYGVKIAPVEYIDLTPNTLRADYRAEYILMVAESYQNKGNLPLAARQLALLGSTHPAEIIQESLEKNNYAKKDAEILKELLGEIRAWQPALGDSSP